MFYLTDLGSGGESVKKLETRVFVGNTATNTAKTELVTVSVSLELSVFKTLIPLLQLLSLRNIYWISLANGVIRIQ